MARAWIALTLASAALGAACGAHPCQELVRECCGEDGQCGAMPACLSARRLRARDVTIACEEARENSYSYPRCGL